METEKTLAELAREHGYLTAAYTEGVYVRAALGFAQGFELYSDGLCSDETHVLRALVLSAVEKTFHDSLEWVERYNEFPFFLFVHTYQIHNPYRPPGRFATMFDPGYVGPVGKDVFSPEKTSSDADRIHLEALYDGEIAYTDEVVGNFLDQLREMRLLDNTVVIIFSDHGEEFWEHGDVQHGDTLYDEQLRVPLIIRLPGDSHPAIRVTRQIALMDLYATVVEMLGIDHRVPTDSMNLAPLMGVSRWRRGYDRQSVTSELRVGRKSGPRKAVSCWMRSVRTDDGKYIISEKSETEELYDLRSDPGERNNIAAEDEARLKQYRELLEAFLKATAGRTASLPTDVEIPRFTEEDKRRLKALGYM
jgi:arylsulfatase A-like enzyme